MKKKLLKYAKMAIAMALIASLTLPSYATVGASDGSAFVTKAEFDSALSDFNARLTTFEAGINSKIDSQVSSYLDRNGIWNGKNVDFLASEFTLSSGDGKYVFENQKSYHQSLGAGQMIEACPKTGLLVLTVSSSSTKSYPRIYVCSRTIPWQESEQGQGGTYRMYNDLITKKDNTYGGSVDWAGSIQYFLIFHKDSANMTCYEGSNVYNSISYGTLTTDRFEVNDVDQCVVGWCWPKTYTTVVQFFVQKGEPIFYNSDFYFYQFYWDPANKMFQEQAKMIMKLTGKIY